MANVVLVDSSVYIRLLRRGLDPAVVLQAEFAPQDLVTCGVVKLEVLRGIRTPKARAHLSAFFSVLQFVPTNNKLWDEAVELAWAMDRAGQVIPATDILIAVSAQHAGASVLTLDHHFAMVPRLSMAKIPDAWR